MQRPLTSKRRSGQAIVEYILLAVVVVGAVMAMQQALMPQLNVVIKNIAQEFEETVNEKPNSMYSEVR
jgi:hypothetical protein